MKLMIYTRDEGITDDTFKDGDIFQIHDDSWEPWAKELQRWLVVQIAGSTGGNESELLSSEYSVGPNNEPLIRRMRKYRLNYAPKLTPEELAAARDRDTTVEVIISRFTHSDIVRK